MDRNRDLMEDTELTPQRSILGLEPKVVFTLVVFVFAASAAAFVFTFCRGKSEDLRVSIPADTLAFLYVRDVGEIEPYLESEETMVKTRDLSFLKGVELGVAITGFETSEQKVAEDSSILNFKPTFAVVADTGSWTWRSKRLIDGPLKEFIEGEYGVGVKRTRKASEFAELIVWTAADGRRAYAASQGSRIFFGNDEKSLTDCLAAANNKIPNLKKDPKLGAFMDSAGDSVVIGYFPRRAIEQFADVAGVSAAVSGTEEEGARTFISRLVPHLLSNSVDGVFWQGKRESGDFVDSVQVKLKNEVAEVFVETMNQSTGSFQKLLEFVPPASPSVTKYSLAKPRLAFRSLLLVAAKNADPVSGRLIPSFSGSLLEPYGIRDPETFLDAAGTHFLTVQTGTGEDETVAVAQIRDRESVLASLNPEIGTSGEPKMINEAMYWTTENSDHAAAILGDVLIVGNKNAVLQSLNQKGEKPPVASNSYFKKFSNSGATAVTLDLSVKTSPYLTETSFDRNGFTRTYSSRGGLLGSLLSGF